jgi:hypothetical protein
LQQGAHVNMQLAAMPPVNAAPGNAAPAPAGPGANP